MLQRNGPLKIVCIVNLRSAKKAFQKKSFKILEPIIVKGKSTDKLQSRTVKEITIVRGKVYEDIMGWTF